ncbi:MAG: ABC transporter ATP-binding protein [Firmicutes bacterium]|nr:ABC transporter ATP-binding protein [Bacillota bacterium]
MTEAAIKTTDLTKEFRGLRAVDGLDLEVPRGIVFGFLGPNGAGKTTTIRLLLGLIAPTAGRAEVLGFDTRTEACEIRARVGALLEHDGLYERLSAEDNLEFYARIWRLPPQARRDRIKEILTHFGLWERRRERTGALSRGMKRKLAVARAVLHRPPLVFLDEPTSGLDPVAAASLREDLRSLAEREGATVFLTTHNLDEAEKICALVGVIHKGRLLAVGSPEELKARGGERLEIAGRGLDERVAALLSARNEVLAITREEGRLTLDLRPGADQAPLVRAMVEAGVEVEEVRKTRASLEEVFLALVEEERR